MKTTRLRSPPARPPSSLVSASSGCAFTHSSPSQAVVAWGAASPLARAVRVCEQRCRGACPRVAACVASGGAKPPRPTSSTDMRSCARAAQRSCDCGTGPLRTYTRSAAPRAALRRLARHVFQVGKAHARACAHAQPPCLRPRAAHLPPRDSTCCHARADAAAAPAQPRRTAVCPIRSALFVAHASLTRGAVRYGAGTPRHAPRHCGGCACTLLRRCRSGRDGPRLRLCARSAAPRNHLGGARRARAAARAAAAAAAAALRARAV